MTEKNRKIGLALGSGGARGLVHLGVLRSLEKNGIEVGWISGSSIGSMVGAMYASGQKMDEIEERIFDGRLEAFLSFLDPTFLKGGMIKGKRLTALVREWLGVESFEDLKIPFMAVATDLLTGEEVRMDSNDLVSAVMASMAVPFVFKPVKRGEYLMVDGGLVNPVPADVVRDMGAETVVGVNLDYRMKNDNTERDYRWAAKVGRRSLNIARHYLAERTLKDADYVINPEIDDPSVMGLKNFLTEKRARVMIKLGEKLMDDVVWREF